MTRLMQWAIVAAACVVTDGWLTPAHADCRADEGDVDVIAADSVTVICDATLPNPFLGGIGSGGTDTNLTVDVG
ncbi:MAG: hypothetical protein O7H39_13380, partial [Gammaproteobacteria bacterium]|nr:hypothetical protein [Gammaproteobacteria bacterium]